MILSILIYVAFIVTVGLVSIGFSCRKKGGAYFTGLSISAGTIVMLLYILGQYQNIESALLSSSIWSFPFAKFAFGVDAISIYFLIPLLILSTACSLYGIKYFKNHSPGILHWLNYALLIAGMVMVLFARNGILFIISWEVMSLASFLLVITDNDDAEVRRSGWIYFVTAHIGTAFLLLTFFMLAEPVHSFDFAKFAIAHYSVSERNWIFIFALIAFGMKAGFMPFHVWLPLAHPVAPSHVSGLMSGIMIKMGIYGILRTMMFIAPFCSWWGTLFIVLGSVSGVLGVLFAIGQHDIKRLLAYHSVENIGIIVLGMGIGTIGVSCHNEIIAVLGFGGALLHIVNHALFKSVLFLGAGAVIRQTKTGNIDALGGLIKKMPWTASMFLIASAAITGLPFLNGFISEILIYAAAIIGTVNGTGTLIPALGGGVVIALAAIGGLASACFTKVYGIVFLGYQRDKSISEVEEVPIAMRLGMALPVIFILIIGLASFAVVPFLFSPLQELTGISMNSCVALKNLSVIISCTLSALLIVILTLFVIRFFVLKIKSVANSETWGCGYTKPDESMQYTSSSFAEPITGLFSQILDLRKSRKFDEKILPEEKWEFSSHVNDWILKRIFISFIILINKILGLLRWIQCGKAGVYVLYMIATLIGLIIWMFLKWGK